MPHSYSAIQIWKQCPRRYNEEVLLRRWKSPESPAARLGTEIHRTLETCLNTGRPIPDGCRVPNGILPLLRSTGAKAEVRLSIDRLGGPAEWDTAYLRGVIDVFARPDENSIFMIDWKTGKSRYVSTMQAHIYAAMCLPFGEGVSVTFAFCFLQEGRSWLLRLSPEDCWKRVKVLLSAIDSASNYPATPAGHCRFCPVATCEHKRG